jgi:hypothetical protein
MSGLSCHPLSPDQASTVFPLVREALPGLDLRAWLRFARRVASPRRAAREGIIVVVRKPRRMPCGLFVYHKEHELGHGPVLVAEHFVAIDLLDSEPVMAALVDELDALAHRLGCTAIRAMVMSQSSQLAGRLHDAGHRPAGEALWKDVEAPGNGKVSVPPR